MLWTALLYREFGLVSTYPYATERLRSQILSWNYYQFSPVYIYEFKQFSHKLGEEKSLRKRSNCSRQTDLLQNAGNAMGSWSSFNRVLDF